MAPRALVTQLFLRIYIEMYPEREEELLLRMSEGRFDIGGTFSEGYESSMLNESEASGSLIRRW